jgi:hypothetical protein
MNGRKRRAQDKAYVLLFTQFSALDSWATSSKEILSGCFTPVTPITWKAEVGKVIVQGQPRQKVTETPISINSWA